MMMMMMMMLLLLRFVCYVACVPRVRYVSCLRTFFA